MNIRTLSFHALVRELEWLYEVVDGHIHHIGWVLSAYDLHIPKIPKRSGEVTLPFYLGAQLKAVFDFAKGEREVTTDFVKDVERALVEMLGASPLGSADPQAQAVAVWATLKERPLGVILLAASARTKLRDGAWLTQDETSALTGLSPRRAQRLGIAHRTVDGQVCYDPEGVRAVLERFEGDDA